ncbi:MAG: FmdE family protein [Oscillospiraceae bacterium]|jgi:formylmethanofuran dehydrogenase subunit E
MNQELWKKCVEFHGHECPGLAIGFRACEAAMEIMDMPLLHSENEELVCVTENDACGLDAVQVITGCTMGKGNLIYRPTGKMGFSFFCRDSGKKIRVVMKPDNKDIPWDEYQDYILNAPLDAVFFIKEPHYGVPEHAHIFKNETCEICGEPASEHKIRLQSGKKVCLDCFETYDRGWE